MQAYPVVLGPVHPTSHPQLQLDSERIIDHFEKLIVPFGSCFSTHLGLALAQLGFNCPNENRGLLHFSAKSLRNFLEICISDDPGKVSLEEYTYTFEDLSRSMSLVHANLVVPGSNVGLLYEEMSRENDALRKALADCDVLTFTIGTSRYLKRKRDGKIITKANGIKHTEFDIVDPDVDEIVGDIQQTIAILRSLAGEDTRIYLTISPQRYLWTNNPSGWLGTNAIDKAKLRVAVDQIAKTNVKVSYFPAYEIVIDELRLFESFTYDFGDNQHVQYPHTSNYVIDKFLQSHCSEEVLKALRFARNWLNGRLINLVSTHARESIDSTLSALLFELDGHVNATGCNKLARSINAILLNKTLE